MSKYVAIFIMLFASTAMAGKGAVAVLDIQGTGISKELLPTLTEILTVEIDQLGLYKVIAGRDVQAMLGFERQKDVLGCTDAACLAEIGGALGVERIVASHIGMVGSTYVVNIKLINIRMADTEGRVYETVRGEVDTLIETIRKSVRKLLGRGSQAAKDMGVGKAPKTKAKHEVKAEPKAEVEEEVAQADIPTVEEKPGKSMGILPMALMGGGGVLILGGVLAGISAKGLEEEANEQDSVDGTYVYGAQAAADSAKSRAMLANFLYVAGFATAGAGVYFMLTGGDEEEGGETKTAFIPTVSPNGAGFAVMGTF